MIPTINPQQMYVPTNMMPVQESIPQYQASSVPAYSLPQTGVVPVYNSIPYNPVYGSTPQAQPYRGMPDISTVKIELNGLEPPRVPGYSDMQAQYMPAAPMATYPLAMPQQPVGMQPMPQAIPQNSMVGAIPPAPNYIQQPAQQPQQKQAAPAPAIDQTQAAAQINQANPQDIEAVKPLVQALQVISPQAGAPEPAADQQTKAIQTIAQFARVADAANQIIKTDPNNEEAKKTKEKVDNLIKPQLINENTFLSLANLAVKDTSKLTGEEKKKADENRIISMWTLAMIQKYFKQSLNEEAQKINIPPISMNEVPGIVQVKNLIVGDKEKGLAADPNPEIREAGIAALVNLADVQDKKDIETMKIILAEAQNDQAPNVKSAAAEALKMYSTPQQVAPQQAQTK